MTKARRSGLKVNQADLPIIQGMVNRGDRRHDIAAWFGLNQGRIKEVEDGKHGTPTAAPPNQLPPSGSPGPRALELRRSIDTIRRLVDDGDSREAIQKIIDAIKEFDRNLD